MRRDGGNLAGCRQARDARLGCQPTEREASLFGCSDQQRRGWNASQTIGPVVELECYGLVEEKHSISPQQLNRLFEQRTVCQFRWLTSNADRYHISCARHSYLSSRSRRMSAWGQIRRTQREQSEPAVPQ